MDPDEDVLLLIGNGGEEDGTLVPVGPTVGRETEVLFPIGNGGEEEDSDEGAVPVGPTVGSETEVLLSMGNGAEEDDTIEDIPVPTVGAVPVGPTVGKDVDVLLLIGKGGKDEGMLDEPPVPVGIITAKIERLIEDPGTVIFGRLDVESEELVNIVETVLEEEEFVIVLGDGTLLDEETAGEVLLAGELEIEALLDDDVTIEVVFAGVLGGPPADEVVLAGKQLKTVV